MTDTKSLREDLETLWGIPVSVENAAARVDALDRLRAFLDAFEKVAELGEKAKDPTPWWLEVIRPGTSAEEALIWDADSCKVSNTSPELAAFIIAARNFIGKWGSAQRKGPTAREEEKL